MKDIKFDRGGVTGGLENSSALPSENKRSWKLVNFCELDKYAIKSYCAIHNVDESLNLGDITKVDERGLSEFNMIVGGSPCFVEGTLVLTESGYKPIEQIKVGDLVLTHNNRWKRVISTMTNESDELCRIKTMPSEDIHCTPNHPLYVRKRYRKWKDPLKRYERLFEDPQWKEAKDLSRDYYVGTAINQKSELPIWNGIIKKVNATDKTFVENRLSEKFSTSEFWYIIGRYMGDGWIRNGSGIIICANDSELYQIIPYLEKLEWHYNIAKERTVNKIHIAFKEIGEYCLRFGRGASNKHLTSDILNLPVDLLKSFIEGFVSSDGTQDNKGVYRITSVSREMIYEFGQCIAKVYHRPFSIYFTQRPKTTVIEGRIVNQKDTYSIHYKLTNDVQDKAFYENGFIWSPINDVFKEDYNGLVYNIEVDEDNSYVVQNIIVHNCQDFSVAGEQKGSIWTCLDCDHKYNPLTVHYNKRATCPQCGSKNIEKTRSSLLIEFLRVIRASQPSFGIYENVANIVGKRFRDTTFKLFEEELHEYNYNTYWKVLNAKDYGIPQNRKRLYLIFIKKGLDNGKFQFPEGFDNGLRLKDFLEDEVDEKFYISDDKVKSFISNLQLREISSNSVIDTQGRKNSKSKPRDVVPTLRAESHGNLPQVIRVENQNGEDSNTPKFIGNLYGQNFGTGYAGCVWDPDTVSPTLTTMQGGGRQPHIITGIDKSTNKPREIEYANCITAREDRGISKRQSEGTMILKIGNVNPSGNGMNGNIFSSDGLSPTITTNKGEGTKIAVRQATKKGYIECDTGGVADLSYPKSQLRRGRVQEGGNICPTLTTSPTVHRLESAIRIRKLTPKETFRLMGFKDCDYEAASQVCSNSQLYKQCGNSIVVDVLCYILVELYKAMPYLFDDLKLGSFFSGIGAFESSLDRLYAGINSGNFTNPQAEKEIE